MNSSALIARKMKSKWILKIKVIFSVLESSETRMLENRLILPNTGPHSWHVTTRFIFCVNILCLNLAITLIYEKKCEFADIFVYRSKIRQSEATTLGHRERFLSPESMDQHTVFFFAFLDLNVVLPSLRFNGQSIFQHRKPTGLTDKVTTYLHGYQHLVFGRAEVVALRQEDFTEGSFAQLPLQNDVSPLDVLDHWGEMVRETQDL